MLGKVLAWFNAVDWACVKLEENDPTLNYFVLPKPSGKSDEWGRVYYTNEEVKKIANAIANNKTVVELTIPAITDEQFGILAAAFKVNKTLQEVLFLKKLKEHPISSDLCRFTQAISASLLDIFQYNKSISLILEAEIKEREVSGGVRSESWVLQERNRENNKKIHTAIKQNQFEKVKEYVEIEGISLLANLEEYSYRLTTPLHTAITQNQYEITKYLINKMLEQGIPIDIPKCEGKLFRIKQIPINRLTNDPKMLQLLSEACSEESKKKFPQKKIKLSFVPAPPHYFSTREGEDWLKQMAESKNEVTRIIFEGKKFSFYDSRVLAKFLIYNNKKTTVLILRDNNINSNLMCEIVQFLESDRYKSSSDTCIEEIEIKNNPIGIEGAKALAHALTRTKRLRKIKIINCGIGVEGVEAIEQAVADNKLIQLCEIEGEEAISQVLWQRNSLHRKFQAAIKENAISELHQCINEGISYLASVDIGEMEGINFLHWILIRFKTQEYWDIVGDYTVPKIEFEKELQSYYQLAIHLIPKIYRQKPGFHIFDLPKSTYELIQKDELVNNLFDAKNYPVSDDLNNNQELISSSNQLSLAIKNEKARLQHNQKNYQEAICLYDEVIAEDKQNVMAIFGKGKVYFSQGNYAESANCFMQILLKDKKQVNTWIERGIALKKLKQLDEALECFDEALKIGGKVARAIELKVFTLMQTGKVSAALDFLSSMESQLKIKTNSLNTQHEEIVFLLKANLLRYQEKFERAIEYYQKCYQENDPTLTVLKIYIYLQQNKLSNAELTLERSVNIPEWIASEIKAFIALKRENKQQAKELFNKAQQLVGENEIALAQMCFARGMVYESWSMLSEAKIYFSKVLRIDPEHPYAATYLARLTSVETSPKIIHEQIIQSELEEIQFVIPSSELKEEQKINAGAFGVVFKATWKGATVAVKKISNTNFSEDAEEEFKEEIKINAKLNFPYLVRFYGCVLEPPCIVMEYMEGGTLDKLLWDKSNEINEELQLRLAKNIATGLDYLHSQNIIHRDLKSPNILLDATLTAKIGDFGLSVTKNTLSTQPGVVTTRGAAGSLPWMAPELFGRDENAKCTFASDVWSLGMVFWEIASQKQPFAGQDSQKIRMLITTDTYPEVIEEAFQKDLSHVMKEMCWKKKPNERASAKQIVFFFDTMVRTKKNDNENSNSNTVTSIGTFSGISEYSENSNISFNI